jgi:AAA+ superfamily predicted ATPase
MESTAKLKDIDLLIRSHFGLIYLDTAEEERAAVLLHHLAERNQLRFFEWSATKGLRRIPVDVAAEGTTDLARALELAERATEPAVYYFHGLANYLDDRLIQQRIKDTATAMMRRRAALFMSGPDVAIPESISPLCTPVRLPEPTAEDYVNLLRHVIRDVSGRTRVEVRLTAEEVERLVGHLRGLTLMESRKILTRVIVEGGRLDGSSLKAVVEAKRTIVEKDGLLEYYPLESSLRQVADLTGLKAWLAKRREIVMNPAQARKFGLTFPRGVLLLGVQGCGKSLCAKAVATEWGLPLLKFDPSALYNKYLGETEKNLKRSFKIAEQMAPVVLWFDEIEKLFAPSDGGGDDGGVSARVLGQFLTWMQERTADVFVIATANDIEKLPPEMLRKGRFDEIFFVDLPDAEARAAVFAIHLEKRGRDPRAFDIPALAAASDGFSGAEIEQAVVSALYTAFASKSELSTPLVLAEIRATRPLSQTMAEKVEGLRAWARGRTVPAN